MVSQVGFGRRAVVWRTLIKTMRKCGDSTHRGVTKGVQRAQFPGCRTVADTGYFGGGMRYRFAMNPTLHRTILRKSITFAYVHLRGHKSKLGLEQWFSKWSISTPRGQLDHPRGR